MERAWFMLDHPQSEVRTNALTHIRIDTTKRKREEGQNISASHYIVEGVGVAGLSAVFGGWRLFVHCYVVTFLFARPLYMATHTYGYEYASIYPDQAIKIPADTSGIIRSSKQDCPDDSDFRSFPPSFLHPSSVSPSHCHHSPLPCRTILADSRESPSDSKCIVSNPFYVKTLTSFVSVYNIIRDGSQSKSYDFYFSLSFLYCLSWSFTDLFSACLQYTE